jgi:hypothetical protein
VIVPPLVLGLVTVAVFAATVNQVVQLWRAPEDRPLRAVALSVLCFAAQAALALPPLHPLLEGTSPGLTRLLVNVAAPLALFWVLAFFLYSTPGPRARHALRVQLVPLVAALAVETAAWTLAPVRVRIAPAAPANAQDPHAVVFVVAALTYMSYALALSLRWSVPYARAAVRVQLRRGLRLISVALAALLTATAVKLVLALAVAVTGSSVLHGLYAVPTVLVLCGLLAFSGGVMYPAVTGMVAAVPVWRRHRRAHAELETLWRVLHDAFPDLALRRVTTSRARDLLRPARTHREFYRRVIEIRDGLVRLRPHYDGRLARETEARARAAGLSGADLTAAVHAALVVAALRVRAAGTAPAEPYSVPVVGGQDLDSDVRWLLRLSAAVRTALDEEPSGPVRRTGRV